MAVNTLNDKAFGRSLGLAYLSDVVADEGIRTIVPGAGIDVNDTNPLNPTVSNAGVLSVRAFEETDLTGAVELKAGSNLTLTQTDQTITIASTAPPTGVASLQGLNGALTFTSSNGGIVFNNTSATRVPPKGDRIYTVHRYIRRGIINKIHLEKISYKKCTEVEVDAGNTGNKYDHGLKLFDFLLKKPS
jgi:hypothetical protein